jgi:hypothetical protein
VSEGAAKPWLTLTPQLVSRTALSIAMIAIGMHYLVSGRKEADVKRMITGALLTIASVFLFI